MKIQARSIRNLPFFWVQRSLLTKTRPSWKALVAYCALANACSDDGQCRNATTRKLADSVGVSERTLQRGLRELADKKAIQIKPHYRMVKGKREMLSNEYILVDLGVPKPAPI